VKRLFLAILVLGWSTAVCAEPGEWLVRVGGSLVAPKSNNHDVAEVEDGVMMTFNGTYFFTENWAIEVLAALPFKHDIDAVGGGNVGEAKHLPPTVSAQYHFLSGRKVRPYVGAGVNYTFLFEEDIDGPALGLGTGVELELDNSVGASVQVGIDFDISENIFLNVEARYIDIDSDAELKIPGVGKVDLGTVEIDPMLYGINLGMRF